VGKVGFESRLYRDKLVFVTTSDSSRTSIGLSHVVDIPVSEMRKLRPWSFLLRVESFSLVSTRVAEQDVVTTKALNRRVKHEHTKASIACN